MKAADPYAFNSCSNHIYYEIILYQTKIFIFVFPFRKLQGNSFFPKLKNQSKPIGIICLNTFIYSFLNPKCISTGNMFSLIFSYSFPDQNQFNKQLILNEIIATIYTKINLQKKIVSLWFAQINQRWNIRMKIR